MTFSTTSLIGAFVLARVRDEESRARAGMLGSRGDERLRECAALRSVVLDARPIWEHFMRGRKGSLLFAGASSFYDQAVRTLAAAHSDHPDYREEWRP